MKETNVELVVQTVVTLGITRCAMLSRKAFSLASMLLLSGIEKVVVFRGLGLKGFCLFKSGNAGPVMLKQGMVAKHFHPKQFGGE